MGLDHVARHGLDDVVVVVHHHIQQKTGFGQQGGFFKIRMENIAFFHVGAAHLGVCAAAEARIEGQIVVTLNGFITGYARQQIFGAAAIPGQKVVNNPAGKDDVVAFHGNAVEPHFRAVGSNARPDHACRITALVVDDGNAVINFLGNNGDVFLTRHGAVRARCRKNADVGVLDAATVQTADHCGNIHVGRLPQPRGIWHDNTHSLTGVNNFFQPGGADGIVQSFFNVFLRRFRGKGNRVGMQFSSHKPWAKIDRKFLVAVLHHIFCHEQVPH